MSNKLQVDHYIMWHRNKYALRFVLHFTITQVDSGHQGGEALLKQIEKHRKVLKGIELLK